MNSAYFYSIYRSLSEPVNQLLKSICVRCRLRAYRGGVRRDRRTSVGRCQLLHLVLDQWTSLHVQEGRRLASSYHRQVLRPRPAYSVSKKITPEVFWHFFPNGWEFLVQIMHPYYTFLSTSGYKFLFNYLQLWRSYAILSATTQRVFRPIVNILNIWYGGRA